MAWRFALMIDPAASDDPRTDFAATFAAVDPAAPALSVGELSTQRGDGIFESIGVVDGHAQEVQAHLDRLVHSAADLRPPRTPSGPVARSGLAGRRALRPGGERHQAHPEPRRRARPGPHRVGDRRGRGRLLDGAPRRHQGRDPRPRLRQRCARARALAAAGREDAVVRGEHGGDPRGEAPRRRRRDLRLVRRHRARGPDRVAHPEVRRRLRHTGAERRHPAGHDPAERVRVARRAGLRRRRIATCTTAELSRADAAWLVSSVRLAAPITEVDGIPIALDPAFTARLNEYLLSPRD